MLGENRCRYCFQGPVQAGYWKLTKVVVMSIEAVQGHLRNDRTAFLVLAVEGTQCTGDYTTGRASRVGAHIGRVADTNLVPGSSVVVSDGSVDADDSVSEGPVVCDPLAPNGGWWS